MGRLNKLKFVMNNMAQEPEAPITEAMVQEPEAPITEAMVQEPEVPITEAMVQESEVESEAPITVSRNDVNVNKAIENTNAAHSLYTIPVSEIMYSDFNPFRRRDDTTKGIQELEALAANIAAFGLIHPPVVNQVGDKFVLISGERRLKAIKILGWQTVDCVVKNISDSDINKGMILSANTLVRTIPPFEMMGYIYTLLSVFERMAENGEITGNKYDLIANELHVTKRQLLKYTHVMANLSQLTEDEYHALEADDLSLNAAYKLIKEREKENQRQAEAPVIKNASDNTELSDNHYTRENQQPDIKSEDVQNDIDNTDTGSTEESSKEELSNTSNLNSEASPDTTDSQTVNSSASNNDDKPTINKSINDTLLRAFFDSNVFTENNRYSAVSLSKSKRLWGYPLIVGDKCFIVIPRSIKTDMLDVANNHDCLVQFKCIEVDKNTLRFG